MASDPLEILRTRKSTTDNRLKQMTERLGPARPHVSDYACVYATGSVGRGEASTFSDLDVFILTDTTASKDSPKPRLNSLDAIRLQNALIEANQAEGFPLFSDDGGYLKVHTLTDMIEKLGGRDDDYENLFTARILLLLESKPLLGSTFYETAVRKVLGEYWRDWQGNESDFVPAYVVNDIVKYWKVLCLNYEERTRNAGDTGKRRLLNYKLKHSRLLTCYSAILYLCYILRTKPAISLEDAYTMTQLTPTDRILKIRAATPEGESLNLIDEILEKYVEFLATTDAPKDTLLEKFGHDRFNRERRVTAKKFGDLMFELLKQIGEETPLFRYLIV
jgi:hypothetical protein